MRAGHSDYLAAVALTALCSATVWAEAPPVNEPEKVAAVATDAAPVTPTPADVAREVVRLQEEMGGSITARFGEVPPWAPSQPTPPQLRTQPWISKPPSPSPVLLLRETAWQLDQSAHQLELLDLYDQADALRETANGLRRDAREMKVAAEQRLMPQDESRPGGNGDRK